MRSINSASAVIFGGATIGLLDGVCASIRAGLSGVPVSRVFQGVASGLFGQAAFKGGGSMAFIGLLLHLFIAVVVMLVYFGVSRRIAWLNQHPWLSGIVYGIAVFGVMNFVVLPLSHVSLSPRTFERIAPGILIHLVAVGWPAAFIARAAAPAHG